MFRFVIVVLLMLTAPAWARPVWKMGAGLEGRFDREVNPEYAEARGVGQLFLGTRWGSWGVRLEGGHEDRESSSGGLHVNAASTQLALWGEYQILSEYAWRPFGALGAGSYLDRVESSYGTSHVESSGERLFWGVGGGVGRVLWKHFLVEAEGRGMLVEDRKDPALSLLMRLGVEI